MAKTGQQRRGLSTVVGAVFMILVMVGAINVMLWTMQQQDRVTQTIIEKTNSNLNKLNEDIDISDIKVTSDNKLNMTVTNIGGAAATVKSIYIVNETAKEQLRYDVDLAVDGRNSIYVDDLPVTVKNDTDYSIKVVTESGIIATTSITPLSSVALPMSLYTIPPTVIPNSNVTVLFTVANNVTDSDLGWAVTPTLQYSCSGCTLTKYVEPSSMTIGKGSTALFKWVYKVSGSDMTTIIFNASLTNARQGNFVTEEALIKLVESAQTSFSSEIIISSSLVQKPEIFLIIPSPFGDSSSQGLWGVTVANPTNQTMEVSRIVWNMYTSKPSANQQMISENTGCDKTAIFPPTASEWSCPHDNMIEWKNVGSPQQITGFDAQRFLLKIKPGTLNAGPEPAFMISVSVFTNMGQFTKTGYSSGMGDGTLGLGNVYMTDTTDPALAVQDSHILGNKSGIASGATVRLNVTIADLDASDTTEIKSGAKLIVNVPRGFTDIVVQSSTGFTTSTGQPKVIPYSDGSTQIVATLAAGEDLGDTSSAEAKVLSFTATTPITNATRVYIMHTFMDGETSTNFSAGAIAELALQVLCEDYPDCD